MGQIVFNKAQLLDELEQQTAALEAAVSHQHWEASQRLMTSRLAILQQLSAEPAVDPQVRQRIVAVATKLAAQEQQEIGERERDK